jgi:hypothetical protein
MAFYSEHMPFHSEQKKRPTGPSVARGEVGKNAAAPNVWQSASPRFGHSLADYSVVAPGYRASQDDSEILQRKAAGPMNGLADGLSDRMPDTDMFPPDGEHESALGKGLEAVGGTMEVAGKFMPEPIERVLDIGAKGFKAEAWAENHQDTVLDNPLVGRLFAMGGLDYRDPPKPGSGRKPETVSPAISEEEFDRTYGGGPARE